MSLSIQQKAAFPHERHRFRRRQQPCVVFPLVALWFPKNGNRSIGLVLFATFNDNLSFCVVVDTKGGISARTKLLVAAAALCCISSGGSLVSQEWQSLSLHRSRSCRYLQRPSIVTRTKSLASSEATKSRFVFLWVDIFGRPRKSIGGSDESSDFNSLCGSLVAHHKNEIVAQSSTRT